MFLALVVGSVLLASTTLKHAVPPPIVIYNNAGPGWGNACLTSPNEAISAAHVIADIIEENLRWVRVDGSATKVGGTVQVVKREKEHDLVVLRLNDGPALLPIATIAKKRPESGDPVVTRVGQSGPPMILRGWYMGVNEDDTLAIDGLVFPGVSGSCTFNEAGEVIGIAVGLRWTIDNPNVRSIMAAEPLVK